MQGMSEERLRKTIPHESEVWSSIGFIDGAMECLRFAGTNRLDAFIAIKEKANNLVFHIEQLEKIEIVSE